ncbi:hypothetical protein IFM89_037174 [Coptis chinensis]|uniref:Uncharacterized protein n=1 Tax=Coptis chinensis TaxID=261450 RepID=A0A835I7E2_9MAGN|nr:hypothetical protein IFM89_037174 [Coptis chinensis]
MEEEGIDDDISETNEEPFDDHIVISPQDIRLNMPSQVVTRGQLQQQQLQKLGNRERSRRSELCDLMLMEEYDLMQRTNTDWLSFGDKESIDNVFLNTRVSEKNENEATSSSLPTRDDIDIVIRILG